MGYKYITNDNRNTSEVKTKKRCRKWTGYTNCISFGGTRAPESAKQAILPFPDHAIQAGNRPVSETGPGSGLQSRRPSRARRAGAMRQGSLHSPKFVGP